MVLINNLTIDEINAALLHLQRSYGEIVGGDKGRTVNNISVSNSGGGGIDYQSVINSLKERLSQIETTNTEQQTQINEILLTLGNLADNGIQDFDYDENSGELTITTKDGEEYTVVIRSPTSTLTFDATTKKLTFTFNDEITEITLPYVASSEKGVANGVATLDSTGRVPYSQLPESAMEFKGEWNAYTNTPHLQDGTGTNGDFYVCTVGGTVNFGTGGVTRNITFYPNDRVIYEGTSEQWFRLPAGEVRTVNGQSGDVVLDGEDINYSSASGSPTIKEKIDTVEGYAKTQSDWGQSNTSAIDYIKNKPNLANVATSGNYDDLSNKPTIPAAQIQSDWTQTDSTKKDFIKNKIPIWITTGSADDNMSPINSVTSGSTRPVTSGAVYSGGSTIINALSTETSSPVDNDYYVAQYARGGTTTTSYHRRPHSALWKYIKSKTGAIFNVSDARFRTDGSTTKIKIKINSTSAWMMCFTVTLYQGYRAIKVMISGYQYGSNHWYNPEARLLGDSDGTETISVYFGYDSTNNLWVGFDGGSYTGVSISDVVNGYKDVGNYAGLFTISNVSSLTTLQTTVTASSRANYAVSAGTSSACSGNSATATTATTADNATKLGNKTVQENVITGLPTNLPLWCYFKAGTILSPLSTTTTTYTNRFELSNGLKVYWGKTSTSTGICTISSLEFTSADTYCVFATREKISDFASGGGASKCHQVYKVSGTSFKIDQQSDSSYRTMWLAIGY